ncbi:hypothetical protein TSAR_012918 [Trichomalopsis sarcophagae]|uniref:Mutator-like transposase domain-containing protein n=1 Tax=Trichomalopsis sarcophagae TaxID=543379 RepID=A0A232EEB5_9HYME|nr:hypothetical protein TSAR_012918 [Trichomalopsis sarcophagae]
MDFPLPIQNATFTKIRNVLFEVTSRVADTFMSEAIDEELRLTRTKSQNKICEPESVNPEAISQLSIEDLDENMLVDESDVTNTPDEIVACKREIEVLSSYCLQCNQYEKVHGLEGAKEWEIWYSAHLPSYTKSHWGSSRSMESSAIVVIFSRSIEKYNVKYVSYLGDGDSSTFLNIINSKPYGTHVTITSTDKNPQHMHCPPGSDSWCKYQTAVAEGTQDTYVHPRTLPEEIVNEIKVVFEKLSEPELLRKCLGGKTQNANESFNNILWNIAPKTDFFGLETLQISAFLACIMFSSGWKGLLYLMSELNIKPSKYALFAAKIKHVSNMLKNKQSVIQKRQEN